MKLVIDTSAVLGVLLNQGPKEWLVECAQGASLMAPSSLHCEIGNALSGLLKRKKLDEKVALAAIDAYQQIPIQFVDVDLKAAIALVREHQIYAYDAYMISCAKQYRVALLSLDKALLEVAKKENIRTLEDA
jgi:predicted nucleic acid-binding protein